MPLPIPVAFAHLLGNYEFHTSNYVMLVYDHMLTFGEEVDKIWSRPFTFPTLLFYLNRYVTHFQYIIIQLFMRRLGQIRCMFLLNASTSLLIDVIKVPEICQVRWSIYNMSGGSHLTVALRQIQTFLTVVMILRVYALYLGNKLILAFLLSLLAGQVIVSGWAVHNGMRVPQPPNFPGCVLTGKNTFFAALWGAPLVTDSCIFILTMWRTVTYMRRHGRMTAMQILLRDGTMYYFAIFGVNLMNTLIYFLALGDLKAVGASFSQILTSIMISRLQLNLRYTKEPSSLPSNQMMRPMEYNSRPTRDTAIFSTIIHTKHAESSTGTFFTLGNLGGELKGTFFETPVEELESFDSAESMELTDVTKQ
ncbi:hypothetical protein BDQ12DRAFT_730726 [Crucibulum laeve]|uniref:DUF6533 domain-containing protein n=1 Tax=Crucibulum laeve TaxID=68775 RepID=A0A5C3ML76_9AGAR|nr:hypothetical protein BDQ12DRAFT_730726 [Crucibulum laeve]